MIAADPVQRTSAVAVDGSVKVQVSKTEVTKQQRKEEQDGQPGGGVTLTAIAASRRTRRSGINVPGIEYWLRQAAEAEVVLV